MLKFTAKEIDGNQNQDNLQTQDHLEQSNLLIDKVRMHVARRKKMEHSHENMNVIKLREQIEHENNNNSIENLARDMNVDWFDLCKELHHFKGSR